MNQRAVVDLEVGTRVVGDLHLDVERARAVDGFCAWLSGLGDCPRLVILGDLFEYWVGMSQAQSQGGVATLEALRERVAAGTEVELLLGNRDFLMDQRLARETGVRIHPEGLLGHLPGGEGVLFLHGDELCTLDRSYQRLRRVLRAAPTRWLASHLPSQLTRRMARRLRRASRRALVSKPQSQKSQVSEAAGAAMLAAGVPNLVVGHAHRHLDQQVGQIGRWLVVDAFGGPLDQVSVGPGGVLQVGPSGAAYEPPAETLAESPAGSRADSGPSGSLQEE